MAQGLTLTDEEMAAAVPQAAAPGGLVLTGEQMAAANAAGAAPADQRGYINNLVHTLLGQGALMGWGDEAKALGRHIVSGEEYSAALADERAKQAAFSRQNPGPSTAASIGGAFLTPGVGLATGMMRAAPSVLGRVGQAMKIGGGFGAAAGAGSAEEGDRLQGALTGGAIGAGVAPAFPLVGSMVNAGVRGVGNAVRGTNIATGRGPAGAEAGADAAMNAKLASVGKTPADLRQAFDANQALGRFNSNSQIVPPSALTEMQPAFRRLGGSVVRSSDKGRQDAETFYRARQTGETPEGRTSDEMLSRYGLRTRNPLEPPQPRSKSDKNPFAAGQHERIGEASKRGMRLYDSEHHGHGPNAYRTEQQLIEAGRAEAKKLFPEAYAPANARPFDLTDPFKALDERIALRSGRHAVVLGRARKLFLDPKTGKPLGEAGHLERFQSAKEQLDDAIDETISKTPKLAHDLREFRRGVVAKAKETNPKYAEANSAFSTNMQSREAMDLGRRALRENSDVTVDHFDALDRGDQKLFREGFLETLYGKGLDKPRSHDVTRVFETQRVQDLLRRIVERSESKGDVFYNRPERLGAYVGAEKSMAESQRAILGGSPTADKLADDAAFSRQTLKSLFQDFRGSPTAANLVMEAAVVGFTKIFGYREDVAMVLARRLFNASPEQIDKIIARLEAVWGKDKVSRLTQAVTTATMAAGIGTGAASGRSREPRAAIPARP